MRLVKQKLYAKFKELGLSRRKFCRCFNFRESTLNSWLLDPASKNYRHVPVHQVIAIAEYLNCTPVDIAEYSKFELKEVADFGDKFAKNIMAASSDDPKNAEAVPPPELTVLLNKYIADKLVGEIRKSNQIQVGKRIGLSSGHICRLVNGRANLNLTSLNVLIRLCPEIFDRNILLGVKSGGETELDSLIGTIRLLAEKITGIDTAKTVKVMLETLVNEK